MTNVLRTLRKRISQLLLPQGSRWLPAAVASVCLLSPLAAVGAGEVPSAIEVRSHEFPNGLVLYHVMVPEATTFKLSATVWVGSVDENPKENAGVSHLLEHILFQQPDMTEVEFKTLVESVGGSANAQTSRGYTQYHVTLPRSHLKLGRDWLSKVVLHDRLVTDRLEHEKEIVNRENKWSEPTWWQQIWDVINPDYLKLPGLWERIFGLPAYDRPAGGTYPIARHLSAAQLDAHYRAYYYPENMVLVYAGPHPFQEVVGFVQATFGTLPATGRKPNLRPNLEETPAPPFSNHRLPPFLSDPEYRITIGDLFTGLRYPQFQELFLYRSVMQSLLEERFRFGQGKAYSVSTLFASYRGAGWVGFRLQAGPDTYWQQLDEVKELVWGDLGTHLSQKEYERYKTATLEQLGAWRDVESRHELTWDAIASHPRHRPSLKEANLSGPWQTFTYEEFLRWVTVWRGQTAPLLLLSMPVVPFPYAHLILMLVSVGLGMYLGHVLLRRRFPREKIALITRVPHGLMYWTQLGLYYVVVASAYCHIMWGIGSSTMFMSHVSHLAMAEPYVEQVLDGLCLGLAVVLGGLFLPRKVLVTDRAVVLKMRSPLFRRLPLNEISMVEPVRLWKAWSKILKGKALPIHPWFLRGLLIHRKSGRPWVIHTTDDADLRVLLSQHVEGERMVAAASRSFESEALAPCPVGPLRSAG